MAAVFVERFSPNEVQVGTALKSFGGGDDKSGERFFKINGPASPFGPTISSCLMAYFAGLNRPLWPDKDPVAVRSSFDLGSVVARKCFESSRFHPGWFTVILSGIQFQNHSRVDFIGDIGCRFLEL